MLKEEVIIKLLREFEKAVHKEDDLEYWYARELQGLLGYAKWESFLKVVDKAKTACFNGGEELDNHFLEIVRYVEEDGENVQLSDIMLTRYACYLITQNGDSRKEEVSFAMSYFAIQTRKLEIIEQRLREMERLQAREKLVISEKSLSGIIFQRGIDNQGFARIKSKGDEALFGGFTTGEMKNKLGVPDNRPLADFLPTITIKAKDFANEITNFNIRKEELEGEQNIMNEHIKNNTEIRKLLMERGIKPEELPAEEDIKKVERKFKSDDKRLLKEKKTLKDIKH